MSDIDACEHASSLATQPKGWLFGNIELLFQNNLSLSMTPTLQFRIDLVIKGWILGGADLIIYKRIFLS